jgi:hypothetical protein
MIISFSPKTGISTVYAKIVIVMRAIRIIITNSAMSVKTNIVSA